MLKLRKQFLPLRKTKHQCRNSPLEGDIYESAIVTSTSTPGSMEMEVICLTISDGEWRSITRLWTRIWNLSQVLEPSPQGVLRVVILNVLVGILTGPLTLRFFSLAPLIRSLHTFSRLLTFLEVIVILMRWTVASSPAPAFPASGLTAAPM